MIDNLNEGIKTYEMYLKRYKNKLNIDDTKKFLKGVKEIYDRIKDKKITIVSDSGKSIDLSWMNDFLFYKHVAEEVKNRYKKKYTITRIKNYSTFYR